MNKSVLRDSSANNWPENLRNVVYLSGAQAERRAQEHVEP
jgi:hypothetical protein